MSYHWEALSFKGMPSYRDTVFRVKMVFIKAGASNTHKGCFSGLVQSLHKKIHIHTQKRNSELG